MIARSTSGNTHIDFKMFDFPFYNRPDLIKGIPFVRISPDSRKHAKIYVLVGMAIRPYLAVPQAASVLDVIGNQNPRKMEFIFKESIGINGIKGEITN